MNIKQAVREVLGVREVPGDEWPCRCFNPDHPDPRPSASVNVVKGLWVCFSCGKGGRVVDLLGGVVVIEDFEDLMLDIESHFQALDSVVQFYPESYLDLYDHQGIHPYWLSRGYSARVCRRFRLGYDYETNRVTYPLWDDQGRLLGVVKRTLATPETQDDGPKYRYPKGVKVRNHLFGYHLVDHDYVVLVEGAMDAIALWDAGIPAVAVYGSSISGQQEDLLRRLGLRDVLLGFDQDKAGRLATHKVLDSSLSDHLDLLPCSWTGYKDWAEMPLETRQETVLLALTT